MYVFKDIYILYGDWHRVIYMKIYNNKSERVENMSIKNASTKYEKYNIPGIGTQCKPSPKRKLYT